MSLQALCIRKHKDDPEQEKKMLSDLLYGVPKIVFASVGSTYSQLANLNREKNIFHK